MVIVKFCETVLVPSLTDAVNDSEPWKLFGAENVTVVPSIFALISVPLEMV